MRRLMIWIGVATAFLSVNATAATLYVTPTGTGNCSAWATACSLTTALNLADPAIGDQIWVKTGTYTPFALINGVKIIGGFAGTETLASQSNPNMNPTIIDAGESGPCVTNINSAPSATPAVLRGFTLKNGRDSGDEGGGMLLENSNAFIVNCIFEENSATHFGGAASIRGVGSPQFVNCIFRRNGKAATTNPRDTKGGGAIFVRNGTPLFVNCLFHNNKAGEGGVVIVLEGFPTFINCTMADNQAVFQRGGAVSDSDGRVTLKNCIIWNNTRMKDPDGPGGQPPEAVADQFSTGSGGSTLATYCDVQGGWTAGSNNIDVDPLFTASYALQTTSPCKNAGDTGAVPLDTFDLDWDTNTIEDIPKDLGLLPRIRLGAVDMGAYELFSDTPPGPGGG